MKENAGSLPGVFVVFIAYYQVLINAWVYHSIYFKRLLLSNEVHTMCKKHSFFLCLPLSAQSKTDKCCSCLSSVYWAIKLNTLKLEQYGYGQLVHTRFY